MAKPPPLVSSPRASLVSAIALASLFRTAASGAAVPVAEVRSPHKWDIGAGEGAPSGVSATAGRRLEMDNWDIVYQNITTDVGGDGGDDLRLSFDVGRGRAHVARILAHDCAGDVTDGVLAPTTPAQTPKDDDHDALALGYRLDRALLVGSNLWDAAASSLKFCHVLELVVPAPADGSLPTYAIAWDKREITVAFDLSADFSVVQELQDPLFEADFTGMRIRGSFNITNVDLDTPEERQVAIVVNTRALEEKMAEFLQEGQRTLDVALSIEQLDDPNSTDTSTDTLSIEETGDLHSTDKYQQNRMLSDAEASCPPANATTVSTITFMIVLLCEGDCEGFADLYGELTAYLTNLFENGEFVDALAEYDMFACADIPIDGDPFEEEPEIIADPEEELGVAPVPPTPGYGSISESASVADYVVACKCGDAQSFACDDADAPLTPNSELRVCIWSRSTDVLLDSVNSMVLVQGSTLLSVIETGQIAISAITTREYVPGKNGFMVSTRVPLDLFVFAAGRSVTVSGRVTTKFAGNDRRGLQTATNVEGRTLQVDDVGGRFQLKISLVEEDLNSEGAIKASTLGNSAAAASQSILVVGVVLSVLHILVS